MMTQARFMVSGLALLLVLCSVAPALAQARYDDEEPLERFHLSFGGFHRDNMDSTIRINSSELGLGTVIQLEDDLEVERDITVLRLDGFYRFNPRHRLNWTFYLTEREGEGEILDEDIQIGDEVFEAGDKLFTRWQTDLYKFGWDYSFVNTRKYEAYIGAGLNTRRVEFEFRNVLRAGGTVERDEEIESGTLPLPTLNLGGRYNFTNKSSMRFRFELFAVEFGDFDGRFQDITLSYEHNTFEHIGFGAAMTSFLFDVEYDGSDFNGEIETDYRGLMVFLKGYF